MKEYSFDSLSNIDVQTLNQPISRSKGEGYQLDVHSCNVRHSQLYTYSRTEGLYRFGPEHSDVLEALDAIFYTVWTRYGDEGFAPTRCKEDGYEVMVTVEGKSECPLKADFSRFQNFTISLNEHDELVEDVDRLFASLP